VPPRDYRGQSEGRQPWPSLSLARKICHFEHVRTDVHQYTPKHRRWRCHAGERGSEADISKASVGAGLPRLRAGRRGRCLSSKYQRAYFVPYLASLCFRAPRKSPVPSEARHRVGCFRREVSETLPVLRFRKENPEDHYYLSLTGEVGGFCSNEPVGIL
jgi:hypothetical protein